MRRLCKVLVLLAVVAFAASAGFGQVPYTTNVLKGNGYGGIVGATPGVDYIRPSDPVKSLDNGLLKIGTDHPSTNITWTGWFDEPSITYYPYAGFRNLEVTGGFDIRPKFRDPAVYGQMQPPEAWESRPGLRVYRPVSGFNVNLLEARDEADNLLWSVAADGVVTAPSFTGDGASLTNVAAIRLDDTTLGGTLYFDGDYWRTSAGLRADAVVSNYSVNANDGDLVAHNTTKGVVLKSPNGHYWRQTISNSGVVTWTDIGTGGF